MTGNEKKEEALQAAAIDSQPPLVPPADFERMFRQHQRSVFRAAYRVTGNASDAEDVLQTVFLRLLSRDGHGGLNQNPEAYLRRSAVNAAVDLLRSRKSSRSVPFEDLTAQPQDRSPGPEKLQQASEMRIWLRKAVSQLNPTAAEMFALRYFEGFGNQEIAKMMGTTQGTVAVTLHRTRSRLQAEISNLLKRNQS